jgi:hypothetical protein
MGAIEQQLRSVRPALRHVAPLTHAICWGYAVINIAIGFGLFFLYETRVPIAVANILSYPQWGVVFLALGAYAAYSLWTNNWSANQTGTALGPRRQSHLGNRPDLPCL